MKYKSLDESVQNSIPGELQLQEQQILNGKCANDNLAAVPVDADMSGTDEDTNEVSKLNILLNGDDIKKSVSRKMCTCSSGMGPCPSHAGTERSSINGYTNSNTQIKYDQIKNTTSKINIKTANTLKEDENVMENHLLLHNCKENGKIFIDKTKHHHKKEDVPAKANEFEDELISSRTFTVECNLNNNCGKPNKGGHQRPFSNSNLDELRLSLTSLISKDATVVVEEKQTTASFQKWLTEKKRQEREIRQRESNLKQLIEQEKQRKIQMEQENFINWLQAKKQKERQARELKKKALEEEKRRKNEKLKRDEINKKQYQLWLKLKEEQDLVKKINEQKRKIEKEERERLRLARNQTAFQDWLICSKDKPKPVPLNRGLESLRASTSVAFVNPAPWVPNIVEKTKASSK